MITSIDPKFLALVTAVSFGIAPVMLKIAFRLGGAMTLGLILGQIATLLLNLALLAVLNPRLELLTPLAFMSFALGGLAGTAIGRRCVTRCHGRSRIEG